MDNKEQESLARALIRALGFATALRYALDHQWYGIVAEIERQREHVAAS